MLQGGATGMEEGGGGAGGEEEEVVLRLIEGGARILYVKAASPKCIIE
jgi:hypothetical protein